MKTYLSTSSGLIEITINSPLANPVLAFFIVSDEDQGDEYELSVNFTAGSVPGFPSTLETIKHPFVGIYGGKYYYSCDHRYISSINSSVLCCDGMSQTLTIENNDSPLVNSVTATGTNGTLCWNTTSSTGLQPKSYVVSFTDDDLNFSNGGLVITVTADLTDNTFRFFKQDTSECYEGYLENSQPNTVNVFRNFQLLNQDITPTPISQSTPTPTPTPARNTSYVQGQIYYAADEDLLVSGNYLIDPQREPRLHSIESGISLVSTASYSISLCHSSPQFNSYDFDGTYFANGYSNSGTYGSSCESRFGRPPTMGEGGVLIYKRNGNNLSQIQSIYPPYVANNRWMGFNSPKFSTKNISEIPYNNLIISARNSSETGIFIYARLNGSDTFSFQTTITEPYYLSLLEAHNGYFFVGGYYYDSSAHTDVGIVKVYKQSSDGSSWNHLQDLPFPQETNAYFGYKVKAHGDTLIVSTFGENEGGTYYSSSYYSNSNNPLPHDKGSVYFYQLNDSGLYELKSSFTDLTGAAIGSVDIKDNVAVLGAMPSYGLYNLTEYGMPHEGFVYVFDKNTSPYEWTLRSETIKSSEIQDYSYYPDGVYNFRGFGFTVALSDDATRLYVTAPVDRDAETGDQVGKIYDVSLNG